MSEPKKTFILNEGEVAVTKTGHRTRKLYCFIVLPICCMCLISCLCSIGLSILLVNYIILNYKDHLVIVNNVSHHNYNKTTNTHYPTYIPTGIPSTVPSNSPTYIPTIYPTEEYEPYNEYQSNSLNNTIPSNYYIKDTSQFQTSTANTLIPSLYSIIGISIMFLKL